MHLLFSLLLVPSQVASHFFLFLSVGFNMRRFVLYCFHFMLLLVYCLLIFSMISAFFFSSIFAVKSLVRFGFDYLVHFFASYFLCVLPKCVKQKALYLLLYFSGLDCSFIFFFFVFAKWVWEWKRLKTIPNSNTS